MYLITAIQSYFELEGLIVFDSDVDQLYFNIHFRFVLAYIFDKLYHGAK